MPSIELAVPVPRRWQDELIRQLNWVDAGIDSLRFDPADERLLSFELRPGPDGGDGALARLRAAADELARSLQRVPDKVLFELPGAGRGGRPDPYPGLSEAGWVRPAADGAHSYHGLMSGLFHALDAEFRRQALALGAAECRFPTLIPLSTLARAGYLDGFPHNANFVGHLPEQAGAVDAFKAGLKAGAPPSAAGDHALAPTVCYHYYASQAGRALAAGETACVTAAAPCYRYEGKAAGGLRRLREFNMREVVCLGAPAEVLARREAMLGLLRRMLELCGLRSAVRTASDPFFVDSYAKMRVFQLSFDLKFEAQAELPYDGSWLAVGSANYHQDHFGRAFGIRLASGEPAHSACLGFGLDRWCLAVFAQHGLDPALWPAPLRALVEAFAAP